MALNGAILTPVAAALLPVADVAQDDNPSMEPVGQDRHPGVMAMRDIIPTTPPNNHPTTHNKCRRHTISRRATEATTEKTRATSEEDKRRSKCSPLKTHTEVERTSTRRLPALHHRRTERKEEGSGSQCYGILPIPVAMISGCMGGDWLDGHEQGRCDEYVRCTKAN